MLARIGYAAANLIAKDIFSKKNITASGNPIAVKNPIIIGFTFKTRRILFVP